MFRFHKTLDVITLFHKPSLPASTKVLSALKQASATLAEENSAKKRDNFELEVTENPPTTDQLRNIIQYLGGPQAASTVVRGAATEADAIKKLRESADSLVRPITVDWSNGTAVVGDNESAILRMVQDIPKEG